MNKTICCVNDLPGVGKIALAAMAMHVLSRWWIFYGMAAV